MENQDTITCFFYLLPGIIFAIILIALSIMNIIAYLWVKETRKEQEKKAEVMNRIIHTHFSDEHQRLLLNYLNEENIN